MAQTVNLGRDELIVRGCAGTIMSMSLKGLDTGCKLLLHVSKGEKLRRTCEGGASLLDTLTSANSQVLAEDEAVSVKHATIWGNSI
eukprot:jgi/Botrbrau1/23151/Bobra.0041s0003.1